MSNPYAEHKQAEAVERIAASLERIAEAVERYADADPLTVLNDALRGAEVDAGASAFSHPLLPATAEPQKPFASNGQTALYRHPDPRFEIVLRKDAAAESGYVATIEEA
jgi:hypothetical protein